MRVEAARHPPSRGWTGPWYLVDDEHYREFQQELAANPEKGPFVQGSGGLRVTQMLLPKPLKPMSPRAIAAIRVRLNVSQPVFASLLNVPPTTERSWEQGKRKPSGAALRLLDIARRQPKILTPATH